MRNWLRVTALTGLLSLGFSVQAAVNLDSPAAKLINKITYDQVNIINQFQAANGWQGFVIQTKKQGSQAILYVDPSNQYLFAGALISADGQNLTQQYTDKYISQIVAQGAYQNVASTHWFSEGSDKAPHKMYVLIDPNCSYCHMMYQGLEPYIAKGQLQVRWVPVGLVKVSSPGKAAHLLSLKSNADQVALLKQDENGFNSSQEEGGITELNPDDPANAAAFAALKQNNAFFNQYQFIGTPILLYTRADGSSAIYAGLVQNADLENLINSTSANW
jgi:thiol:disulfide interchange protein DsbG